MVNTLVHPANMISSHFRNLSPQITCPALFMSADVEKGAASGEQDIIKIKNAS